MTGKELRRKRRELELSQAKIAKALGVSQTAIYYAEKEMSFIGPKLREAYQAYLLEQERVQSIAA